MWAWYFLCDTQAVPCCRSRWCMTTVYTWNERPANWTQTRQTSLEFCRILVTAYKLTSEALVALCLIQSKKLQGQQSSTSTHLRLWVHFQFAFRTRAAQMSMWSPIDWSLTWLGTRTRWERVFLWTNLSCFVLLVMRDKKSWTCNTESRKYTKFHRITKNINPNRLFSHRTLTQWQTWLYT